MLGDDFTLTQYLNLKYRHKFRTMDVAKVAKQALQFSEHLPDDHESKEEMVALATKWIADHQRNPHTLSAMTDARVIQVY
jgi:hypothetical protein